ncbi:MAG: KpsF/GutQ family sugar-phosphate isomerase [Candidatus Krumholzibacteriota bacterium]|nr:KpsF/GutQ family sugar-phosphate isomerase [Candidatus Krumholzibacteriota bacterium]
MSEKNGDKSIIEIGREVLSLEIEGLQSLYDSIDGDFEKAVGLILSCSGKVIVCGIGKSGIIARKIAATFSSTGTPSVFLHPVEAAHGDMGMMTSDDLLLAVSKSGGDDEFSRILPFIKNIGISLISITGSLDSPLARQSDVILPVNIAGEACPMDIVPTTSTTASLVLGDALAVAVFRSRDFSRDDFARLHPGGILGKRLIVTTGELMHSGEEMPLVGIDTLLKDALFEISEKRLGCTGVIDSDGRLAGMITDGDIKRFLIKDPNALGSRVSELMTPDPRTTRSDHLAVKALEDMEMNPGGPITQLFVIDDDGKPVGLIHLHDILRAGLK